MAGSKTYLINASSVKYGGAATILNSFMDWIAQHDSTNQFVLMSSYCPPNLPSNVRYVEKYTSGMGTLWFCTIGVLYYLIKYRASCCISLSNINLIFPIVKRITYFHQAKVFVAKDIRFRLMALAIHCLKGSTVVVQSPLIKTRFIDKFGRRYSFLVKWPGLEQVEPQLSTQTNEKLALIKGQTLLWPVTDPYLPQKNLDFLIKNADWLTAHNVQVLVTSDNPVDHPSFVSIGRLPKADLMSLYSEVDGVVIVSEEETVCLPIFEAAQQGSRVFVLDRPYIRSLEQWRGLPENVTIFNDIAAIVLNNTDLAKSNTPDASYFESDWQIY